MLNRNGLMAVILIVLVVATMAGCGGSSSTSAANIYTQDMKDSDTVWAVDGGIVDLYNTYIAYQSAGGKNTGSVGCPNGGSVTITGSTYVDTTHNGTGVNLTYVMTACHIVKTTGNLTVDLILNGTITEVGTFNGAGYKAENFSSPVGTPLNMVGTAGRTSYPDATIDQTCDYAASTNMNNYKGSTSGTICGRTVSWSF